MAHPDRTAAIGRVFRRRLNRDPDQSGLGTFSDERRFPDEASIDAAVVNSDEFRQRTSGPLQPRTPGFVNLERAGQEIDERRRALTEAIAREGQKGRESFDRALAESKAAQQRAVEAALRGSAGAPEGAGDELAAIIGRPQGAAQESITRQRAIFDEDIARRTASNESLLSAQAAALPTIEAQLAREIALLTAEKDSELAQAAAQLAARGRGRGGGGGGGRGGKASVADMFGGLLSGRSEGAVKKAILGTTDIVADEAERQAEAEIRNIAARIRANPFSIRNVASQVGRLRGSPTLAQALTARPVLARQVSQAPEFGFGFTEAGARGFFPEDEDEDLADALSFAREAAGERDVNLGGLVGELRSSGFRAPSIVSAAREFLRARRK